MARIVIGQHLGVLEEIQPPGRKTKRWSVWKRHSDYVLGFVHWLSRWRQYTYCPEPNTEYNAGCMKDIAAFLKAKTQEQLADAYSRSIERKKMEQRHAETGM